MCRREYPSEEEIIKLANQDGPVSREQLGIQTPSTRDGLQALNEGFDMLQYEAKNSKK